MNELALFAGAGGGILGGQLLGWRTVCAVEIEPYPASVLLARQNDGLLPPFPVWDDIRTFDGRPWAGIVDVVSGGFPCQDISAAGNGAGLDGERSGLWVEMERIIGEVRPAFVYVENSPMLTSRGLGTVLGDLATLGFDARWGVLGAADVGAPHQRDRIWIVANAKGHGWKQEQPNHRRRTEGASERKERGPWDGCEVVADTTSARLSERICRESGALRDKARRAQFKRRSAGVPDTSIKGLQESEQKELPGKRWRLERRAAPKFCGWSVEPDVGRVAHGVAARVDRIKAIGNGQVPQCAAEAWRLLIKQLENLRE